MVRPLTPTAWHPPPDLAHSVVAWEWIAAADHIVASPSLMSVYGVATIENVSRGFTLVHPDDHDAHQALVHAAVDRGRGYRSSFRIIRPDTSAVVWIAERAEAIEHGAGEPPELIGLAFDVTARHQEPIAATMAAAIDALEIFGDALLTAHARARRRTSRAQRADSGAWVAEATREFHRLSAMVDIAHPDAGNRIRAATIGPRDN